MKNNKKDFHGVLYTIYQSLKIAWKPLWRWLLLLVLLMIIHSVLIIVELIMQKNVINDITVVTKDSISQVVVSIIILFLVINFKNLVMTIRYICSCWVGPALDKILKLKLLSKYKNIDMINYERSQYYDQILKAGSSTYAISFTIVRIFQAISGHLGTIIGVLSYVAFLRPELSVIVFLSMVPDALKYLYQGRKNIQQQEIITPVIRKTDYLSSTMTEREYFKETRIMNAESFLVKLWVKSIDNLNKLTWKLHVKFFSGDLIVSLSNFITYAATLLLCLYYLQRNIISLGAFSTILTSVLVLKNKVSTIISNFGNIYRDSKTGQYFFNFLKLKERSGENKDLYSVDEISLQNVNFKYDEGGKLILNNINLKIKKGEIIAIVGENGAGKTTLQKIITGMLMPNDGKVYYNGFDASRINEDSLYKGTSALFQQFGRYQLTLGENVFLGETQTKKSNEKILKCIEKSGFNLSPEKFPNKLETKLGTSFGGQDLSGGEWQQIALARAYYKESNVIFLDEPTSAIDPLKESKMFSRFVDLCKGKTAIMITHRLGIVKIANKIVFMKNGSILAVGSHDELMSLCSDYKEMYEEQTKYYNR